MKLIYRIIFFPTKIPIRFFFWYLPRNLPRNHATRFHTFLAPPCDCSCRLWLILLHWRQVVFECSGFPFRGIASTRSDRAANAIAIFECRFNYPPPCRHKSLVSREKFNENKQRGPSVGISECRIRTCFERKSLKNKWKKRPWIPEKYYLNWLLRKFTCLLLWKAKFRSAHLKKNSK